MTAETPAEGYPVRIALPGRQDGPLALSFRDGSRAEFEIRDGHAEASTRARAGMLLELGGHLAPPAPEPVELDAPAEPEPAPTNTPPTGSGTKSRRRAAHTS